jgi:ABC-type lipoprotein export system ATPase subunit
MSNDHKRAAADALILRADGLVKYYADGHVQALRGVSLTINASESVAITGPSGCGKSTLLHILGGLDRPTQGEVYFREKPIKQLDIDEFRAHQVGFVFQSFYLMPTLTALENIQIPMFEGPWSASERVQRAIRLIEEVGLTDRRNHRPSQLSVGQRQRIAIARSLANDPSIVLADEPTGNLDSKSQDEIIQLLHRLRNERQLTLLIVTHSHEVAQAADRRIPMKDGQIQPG